MAWRPASPAPASIEAASGQHPGIMRQDNRGNSAILPHCFGGICWAFHGLEYLARGQGFGIGIHEPAGQPRHHGGHQFRRSASAPETGRAWHHPGKGRRLGGAGRGLSRSGAIWQGVMRFPGSASIPAAFARPMAVCGGSGRGSPVHPGKGRVFAVPLGMD